MSRDFRSFRQLTAPAKNKAMHWHRILVMLVLALYIGGVSQTISVQAAPPANETIDSFDISTSPIPNPACAHSLYEVSFFARVDRVAELNGNKVNLERSLGPSTVSVKAASSDTGIAEFHPDSLVAKALDNRIGKGADFKLKTEAPGSATLTFTGKIEWTGNQITFPPLQQPIKVVNCRFKITITSISSAFGPDIVETAVSTVTGEISGEENAALTGEADVTWNTQQATPCLSAIQTVSPSKANLEGSLSQDGDSLTVRVTYEPAMMFQQNTITCGVDQTSTQQHQFQTPPQSFTVPITGGSLSQPVSIPMGEMALTGTAIITVVPIEGK